MMCTGDIKATAISRVKFESIDGVSHWKVMGGGPASLAVEKWQAHARANKRNVALLERIVGIILDQEWNSDLRQVLLDELGVTQ